MTGQTNGSSPSLEAVRALERQLTEQEARRSGIDAALAAARQEAEQICARARSQGNEIAARRHRQLLEEADREAGRIRADGERRASELRAAMAARRADSVLALSSIVLPAPPVVLPDVKEPAC